MSTTQHPSTFWRPNYMQTWESLHRQSRVPNVPVTHTRLGILHTDRAPNRLPHISSLNHCTPPRKDLLEEDRSVKQVKRPGCSSWLQLLSCSFFFFSIPLMKSAPSKEGREKVKRHISKTYSLESHSVKSCLILKSSFTPIWIHGHHCIHASVFRRWMCHFAGTSMDLGSWGKGRGHVMDVFPTEIKHFDLSDMKRLCDSGKT